jgi:hypothetical protein
MNTVVVNARFAGMKATGVQRSAHEIVSRLILDNPDRYALVSPRFYPKYLPPSLQVKHCGYFRHAISGSKSSFRELSGGRVETPSCAVRVPRDLSQ